MNPRASARGLFGRLLLVVVAMAACRAERTPPAPVETQRSALALCSQTPLAIAAGSWHNCALLPDHTVECWGSNFYGQLGIGTTTPSPVPRSIPGLTNVTALSAGVSSTCALLSNGHVTCWGNAFGTAGTAFSTTPVEVPGLTNVTAIATRGYAACALLAGGTVKCWGGNSAGTVGDGTTTDRPAPVDVVGVDDAVQISTGLEHVCALRAGGGVKCWGGNWTGELGDGTNTNSPLAVDVLGLPPAAQIEAGPYFTCAVLVDGTARCWGFNNDGELGSATTPPWSVTPVVVPNVSGAAEISAGAYHVCARLTSGAVRCWGYNFQGQLGVGAANTPLAPGIDVQGLGGPATAISLGRLHSCALTASGIRCWGLDDVGELGNGIMTDSPTPAAVAGLSAGVAQIATGVTDTCARLAGGALRCWGENFHGSLGVGTTIGSPAPLAVTGLPSAATQISSGRWYHRCAQLADGSAWCWGFNITGQLGDGTTTDQPSPVAVQGLPPITQISAGGYHTCARTTDGHVTCWGENYEGELGDPTIPATSPFPHEVPGLAGIAKVSAGWAYVCAVTTDGSVLCWGANESGQLGDGSNVRRLIPTTVNLAQVADIIAGNNHTCALLLDGSVSCWGSNWAGQLGDGTTTDSFVPVQVAGLTNVVGVSLGDWHTCALTSDGRVSCWGHNSSAQLGDGTFDDALTPRSVPNLSGVVAMEAGGYFTCAVLSGGALKCWGDHAFGELGTGVEPGIPTPVDVLCSPGGGDGQVCSAGGDCNSGFCVDGVCCGSACGGGNPNDCQVCSVAAGGSADGTCAPLPAAHVCRPAAGVCDVAESCGAILACPADATIPGCTAQTIAACLEPTCSNLQVSLDGGTAVVGGVSVDFQGDVTSPGEIAVVQSGSSCPPPTGFQILRTGQTQSSGAYWNIDVTAGYSGNIRICLHYAQGTMPEGGALEQSLRIVHGTSTACNGSGWVTLSGQTRDMTNNILCGNTTSLSPFAIVAPLDTTAPLFSAGPAIVVAYASSTTGAKVAYTPPAAVDEFDGPVPVTCTPAPGSTFAPGTTDVVCSAADTSENAASKSFSIWVQVQAPTDGTFFLPPIVPDGTARFNRGSTIPVKFKLTGASAAIKNLVAHLSVARVSNGAVGPYQEADSTAACAGGGTFRYDPAARQYIFNLSTKKMPAGTWSLRADLGDDVDHVVKMSLR